jgi:hypothetical protein
MKRLTIAFLLFAAPAFAQQAQPAQQQQQDQPSQAAQIFALQHQIQILQQDDIAVTARAYDMAQQLAAQAAKQTKPKS